MKPFLQKTILFLLLMAAGITVIQAWVSFRIRGKTIRGHDNLEQTSGIDADLLFMGSSRCWAHFDPRFFDSAYGIRSVNIGVDGHSELTMTILRLNDYLARNKAPRVAILSFDPFMSAGTLTGNTNFVHKNDFARYAFFPSRDTRPVVDYFQFDLYERYAPLYALFKYKLFFDAIFLDHVSNWVTYGYEMHDETWDTIARPVTDIMKTQLFKLSEVDSISISLKNLNSLCRQYGIALVCIQTPVYKACYDERLFRETREICSRSGIPFIDTNMEAIRNDIGFFYNSNHLNKRGVDSLNRLLAQDSLFSTYMARLTKTE